MEINYPTNPRLLGAQALQSGIQGAGQLFAQLQQVKAQQEELQMKKKEAKFDAASRLFKEAPDALKVQIYNKTIRPMWSEHMGTEIPELNIEDVKKPSFADMFKTIDGIDSMKNLDAAGKKQLKTRVFAEQLASIGQEKAGLQMLAGDFETDRPNFSADQAAAIRSGDPATLAGVFPGGIPKEALSLSISGQRLGNTQEEREASRKDKRNKERTDIVTRFNADPSVKKAQQSIDAANTIRGLVDSGNPIAAAAIPTFMARASGEVGNLSEADKRPFGGSLAINAKLAAAAKQAATGRLTEDNARFVRQLADVMEKRSVGNLDSLGKTRSKQYAKASDFLNEDDLFATLRPESIEFSGQPDAPSGQQSGLVKIASDAEYNALPPGAQFVGPDGKLRRKP